MSETTKDAVERAQEFFSKPGREIPKLAFVYAQELCRRYGGCCEVIISAYAHYAQLEEGLPCNDDLYCTSEEDKELFASVKASLTD